jgi:imidazolonepropionase-like amidohydrolase
VFIVDGARFVQVGRTGEVRVPNGAARVSLAGKTVMPAIVDTHTHLSQTREALVDDLKRRAFYGVSAAMSLGQDTGDVAFQVRAETIPGAALFRTAGRGITMPEPGRTEAPYWISTEAEGRKAVQELATKKVDIVSHSKTRKGCCVPASTRLRTAYATEISTRKSSRYSNSIRMSSSSRTFRIAALRRI